MRALIATAFIAGLVGVSALALYSPLTLLGIFAAFVVTAGWLGIYHGGEND